MATERRVHWGETPSIDSLSLPTEERGKLSSKLVRDRNNFGFYTPAELLELVLDCKGAPEFQAGPLPGFLRRLPHMIGHNTLIQLIDAMAQKGDRYRYQLGLFLATIPPAKLPSKLRSSVSPEDSTTNLTIYPTHPSWYLCSTSERLLFESIEEEAVVLVNEGLLVKYEGRHAALCIKPLTTNFGIFVPGNWYSPVGKTRDKIDGSFRRGESRLGLNQGAWALMRAVQWNRFRVRDPKKMIQDFVTDLPSSLSQQCDGLTRSDFITKRRENY